MNSFVTTDINNRSSQMRRGLVFLLLIGVLLFLLPAVGFPGDAVGATETNVTGLDVYDFPKTEYYVGEEFDSTGGQLRVFYADGSSAYIDMKEADATGFDSSAPGTSIVTLTYQGQEVTVTTTILAREDISGLKALADTKGRVTLTWNSTGLVASFRVARSNTAAGPYTVLAETEEKRYTDSYQVPAGTTVYYAVTALDENGEPQSEEMVVACSIPAINAPVLTAVANSNQTITIKWKAVEGATGYELYRSTSENGDYTLIQQSTEAGTGSYTDSSVTVKTTYYYYAIALAAEAAGNSCRSDIVSATVKLPMPKLSVTLSGLKATLTWSAVSGSTGYVLYRSTGTNGSWSKLATLTTSNTTTDALLEIARGQIGYYEKASNKNLDSFTANKGNNNYQKYGRDLYNAGYYNSNCNGQPWCDVFVDWCFWKLCGENKKTAEAMEYQTGDSGCSCSASMACYKAAGAFYSVPKVGDQIFISSGHTGIVESVDKTNKEVTVIAGNSGTPGCVKREHYTYTASKVLGFGRPRYTGNAYTDSTLKAGTTYRYYMVATCKVSAATSAASSVVSVTTQEATSSSSATNTVTAAGKYVTTAKVNLRKGKGTSTESLGTVPKGTTLTVTSVSSGWAKTTYSGKTGYVSTSYLKAATATQSTTTSQTTSTSSSTVTKAGKYVTTAKINLRKGKGTSTESLGTVPKGTTLTVTSVSSGWAKTTYSGKTGYVSTSYLKAATATQSTTTSQTTSTSSSTVTKAGKYVTTAKINLRKGKGSSTASLGTIPKGTTLTVTSVSSGWAKTTYSGQTGYVSTGYLKAASSTTKVKYVTTAKVNMRSGAGTSYSIVTSVPKGTTLTVTATSSSWLKTTYSGKTGWISAKYAQKQ